MLVKKDLDRLYTLGFEFEQQYGNCAQCTLAAILDVFRIQEATLFKAATPLSGGTGSMGDGNCGAYSGGALAIGLFFGRSRSDFANRDATKVSSELTRQLRNKFMETYGGVTCHAVQQSVFGRSFNLTDPIDRQAFEAEGAHIDKCPNVVAQAAQWTGKIIMNHNNAIRHSHNC
jgi:C_GCAxxG_C_C family probable redox protein